MSYTAYLLMRHRVVDGIPVFAGLDIRTESASCAALPPGVSFYTELERLTHPSSPELARHTLLSQAFKSLPWTRAHLKFEPPLSSAPKLSFDDVMLALQKVLGAPHRAGVSERDCVFASWGRTQDYGAGVDANYPRDGSRPYVRVDLYTPQGCPFLLVEESGTPDSRLVPRYETAEAVLDHLKTKCVKTVRVPLAVACELSELALKGRLRW